MKTPWTRRLLAVIAGVALLGGGLAACGHRDRHAGWSDERVTEMRGRAVERVSSHLDLTPAQRARLDTLADAMLAARRELRGEGDPRAGLRALVAGDRFDREGARRLFDARTQALGAQGPQVITAFAEFYDSLDARQQQLLRERMDKGGRFGGWRP